MYWRDTVPGVANRPIRLLLLSSLAVLMAGTTPIMGVSVFERKLGKTSVLAVLQAMMMA